MIARLLRDKGVYQFVDAARIVKRLHPAARFILVGPFDPDPAVIGLDELSRWVQDGVIEFLGPVEDVRLVIANCTVYVHSHIGKGIGAVAICVGIDVDAISSMTRLPHQSARSMI